MVITVLLISAILALGTVSVNAVTLTATAKIDSKDGAILRKSASTSSASVKVLANNSNITIKKEVFTTKKSTAKTKKWYYVTAGKKTGYVRSDLVDNVKYSYTVKAKTTAALNYRKGAGDKMPLVDTFKKKATVYKVLPAKAKGSSVVWYKLKVGQKYYYASGKYIKNIDATPVTPTNPSDKIAVIPSDDTTFPISSIPLWRGQAFTLRGTLTCPKKITAVTIGIKSSAGVWRTGSYSTYTVNDTSFDISKADSAIKFGKLPVGDYVYYAQAEVNNGIYKAFSHKFSVKNPANAKWQELINKSALALAWDETTAEEIWQFNGGAGTDNYVSAFNQYASSCTTSGNKFVKVGADCGVFVATAIRSCGFDSLIPTGLTGSNSMFTYLESEAEKTDGKWMRVSYSGVESELELGDIVMYHKSSGQHVLIYVVKNGVGYLAEAANTGTKSSSYYPRLNTSLTKILSPKIDSYQDIYVYRAVK